MAKPTDPIYFDAETIPSQERRIVNYIRAGIEAELAIKVADLRAKANDPIKVPKTYTKPESIEAYISEKKAEIAAGIESSVAEAIAEARESFDKKWRATALDGAFGQVAVLSLAFGEDQPIALYGEDWQEHDYEERLLRRIMETVNNHLGHQRGAQLVGHNILGFDRHFVRQRCLVRGVPCHPVFSREVKPWDMDAAFDTMIGWSGDPRKMISLDKLLLALDIPMLKGAELDEEIDGSLVWDFIRDGKIAKVARYCDYDVIRARAIHYRLQGRPLADHLLHASSDVAVA